jgi:ribosome-associated protein
MERRFIMKSIEINTEYIKLDQFLKWAGVADSGSFAKIMIANGDISVNGKVALERGKKLHKGDIINITEVGEFQII